MMKRIGIVVMSMAVAVLSAVAARVYSFMSIGGDMGLSSNNVKCIYQDSYGFMWFGTKNGLNRYDGKVIQSYECYDHVAGRGNNNIGAIFEDADRNIWVGTDRGVYIYDPRTEKFSFIDTPAQDGVTLDYWVQEICRDKDGNIWVLIPNQGLFRFYGDNKVAHYNVPIDGENMPAIISCTFDGDVFVGTIHNGLFRYSPMKDVFQQVTVNSALSDELNKQTIQFIKEDSRGQLILFTQIGNIYRYNVKSGEVSRVRFSKGGNIYLRTAEIFDDEIWIGTQNGLYIINMSTGKEVYLNDKSSLVNGLTDNLIYTVYKDKQGNTWIGTMFGGVNFYQRSGFVFEKFMPHPDSKTLSSARIRGVAAGADSLIYVGTEDGGVNLFNPRTGFTIAQSVGNDPLSTSLVMRSFGGNVYSGWSREGMDVYSSGQLRVPGIARNIIGEDCSVYAVLVDKNNNMWVGGDWGLSLRKAGENEFKIVDSARSLWVFDLCEDSKGRIWIAAMGEGVAVIDTAGNMKLYSYDETYSNGLRSNSVSSIFEDSSGRIWVSTDRGGLSLYNPDYDNFETFGIENGLPDNVVYDIVEDNRGFLWFGTNNGLVKFNPETRSVKVFTTADGLPDNQFNYHSATTGLDGNLYFGCINGLVAFDPELAREPDSIPPVYFTRLSVANGLGRNKADSTPYELPLMYTDRVEIPYNARYISIDIASPNYVNTGTQQYYYRMLPVSEEWNRLDADQRISFDRLMPGNYTLEVKVEGDGKVVSRTLNVKILPPWYNTWWAWIIYILILMSVVYLGYVYWRRRRELALKEKEYVNKVQAAKELYENKVQFFSEIAHEIRTPLTLIDSPLEAIEEIGVKDARIDRYFKVIRKNTSRLLDLVSQLLDFQKIGNSRKQLTFEYVNVSATLSDIITRFQDAIALKKKELYVSIPETPVHAMIDKEAFTKIVSNLLNNAMKYANCKIEISLTSDDTSFSLRVKSDGKKITGGDVYSIFTPFYQMPDHDNVGGVGIGLPLCRMLASLHNGSVELEIDDEPENTFVLTLPLRQEGAEIPIAGADPVMTEYVMDDELQSAKSMTGNSMLLVEDNEEMRTFLYEQVSRYFVVDTAENGKEALELLHENNYDIVVTDIMMPEMDGYELCRAIKDDVELSHIPVVFLTAKNDLDSKVQALQCGGEAYIEKPFSIKYFRQQVISLLENRRHERRSLIKKPFFTVDNMKMSKADEEFMNKVIQTIQDHISDENFNVELMADVLCMSRSSLLRKIKSLFNLSPIELIRLVKLKKAAELIKDGKYRIGDICYMVGINSSSYFSKLFLKQFGVTPKAFEMQCQKNARGDGHEIEINLD
ncbi:MAG: response regulator [Muribaculum sp.]|nr:response regulator [Muribaculum sp.]